MRMSSAFGLGTRARTRSESPAAAAQARAHRHRATTERRGMGLPDKPPVPHRYFEHPDRFVTIDEPALYPRPLRVRYKAVGSGPVVLLAHVAHRARARDAAGARRS